MIPLLYYYSTIYVFLFPIPKGTNTASEYSKIFLFFSVLFLFFLCQAHPPPPNEITSWSCYKEQMIKLSQNTKMLEAKACVLSRLSQRALDIRFMSYTSDIQVDCLTYKEEVKIIDHTHLSRGSELRAILECSGHRGGLGVFEDLPE